MKEEMFYKIGFYKLEDYFGQEDFNTLIDEKGFIEHKKIIN